MNATSRQLERSCAGSRRNVESAMYVSRGKNREFDAEDRPRCMWWRFDL
jgi:hypothetical protein